MVSANDEYTQRLIVTVSLYYSFFTYGLEYAIVSPTMLLIRDQLCTDFENVSYAVLIRSFNFCLGSLAGGWLFSKIDRRLGLLISIVGSGIAIMAISLTKSYVIFIISMSLQGVMGGFIDVATTAWILNIWQDKSNPYMQGLHFSYGVGMTVAPLLSAPFLSHRNATSNSICSNVTTTTTTTGSSSSISYTGSLNSSSSLSSLNDSSTDALLIDTPLTIPYGIVTVLLFTAAISQFLFIMYDSYRRQGDKNTCQGKMTVTVTAGKQDEGKIGHRYKLSLVIAGCALVSFYTAGELNSMFFASNYVTFLGNQQSTGAHLTTLMLASFSIFRLLSIYIATKLDTLYMIYIHLIMIGFSNIILYAAGSASFSILAIAFVLLGASLSSVFPALYALMEELIDVTNFICGLFMFCSAIAVSVTPILEGAFLESNPNIFIYINCIALVACSFVLFYIHLYHR